MSFDLRSFAAQVRPSPKKPSPDAFDNGILDAGSPQYVRPEDLFLDVQARLFGLKPLSAQDISGIDPSDFNKRWSRDAIGHLTLQRVGTVGDEQLCEAVISLLRCSPRKKEWYPTLLPMVPSLSFYKNIKPNLPNFLNDQFRPALSFADDLGFVARMATLKQKLCEGSQANDSLKLLAKSMLPVTGGNILDVNHHQVLLHEGPLLRNYSVNPSQSISVCGSLLLTIDVLVSLEDKLPRILWTRWLTAVLRIWLPLFFLKRCAIASAAANAAKSALITKTAPVASDLSNGMLGANAVLRGSREWLNQLAPIVQNYVRSRFEISILLELTNLQQWLSVQSLNPLDPADRSKIKQQLDNYTVDPTRPNNPSFPSSVGILQSVKLSMPGDSGSGKLALDTWIKFLVDQRPVLDEIARIIGADDVTDLVEKVYSYLRPEYEPLKSGFGKNAYEYVAFALGAPRKADRHPEFPDEFNLLYRSEGGRRARQVMIQPGPQLLTLLVQLVHQQAVTKYHTTAKLSDVLDLLDDMGVDFRTNPEDFDSLKNELLRLGLLRSSADAAEAASLNPVYNFST